MGNRLGGTTALYPNAPANDAASVPVRLATGGGGLGTAANPIYTAAASSGSVVASTSNVTSVAVSNAAGGVQLLAANSNRKDAVFYNANTAPVLVILGSQAPTQMLFSKSLQPGETWPLPVDFTGPINAISTGATGSVLVTELT